MTEKSVAIDLLEAKIRELEAIRTQLQAENTALVLKNRDLTAQIELLRVELDRKASLPPIHKRSTIYPYG